MIFGIGTDIQDIQQTKNLYIKKADAFLSKCFTENEIEELKKKAGNAFYQTLTGKYAAKEAFSKAYGTGIGKGLSFHDIEILNDINGKPILTSKKIEGEKRLHISISHSKDYATAMVIIEQM